MKARTFYGLLAGALLSAGLTGVVTAAEHAVVIEK